MPLGNGLRRLDCRGDLGPPLVNLFVAVADHPEPRPELPRSRGGVELFWALVPAVGLGVLFFFTWRAIELRASLEQHSSASAMAAAR
jgi:hypothetical protein